MRKFIVLAVLAATLSACGARDPELEARDGRMVSQWERECGSSQLLCQSGFVVYDSGAIAEIVGGDFEAGESSPHQIGALRLSAYASRGRFGSIRQLVPRSDPSWGMTRDAYHRQ
jgi:hypothetical protein